jgi:glycosyltransferase involved in cell wall biosynthesis
VHVSIIICCYNSAIRIKRTLEHLAQLHLGNLCCELILVDNNCTDNTVDLASRIWVTYSSPFPIKVVTEMIPGLSNARRAGVLASQGEIIIFCDDDNWLDKNYVVRSFKIMGDDNNIGALCGTNIATADIVFPEWFTTYQKFYAVGVMSFESGDVTHNGWIWGAGMVFRRKIMIDLWESGFKHHTTDRKGSELSTGGDVEICKWLIFCGYKLIYDSSLLLYHFIPKERISLEYLKNLMNKNYEISDLFKAYDKLVKLPSNSEIFFELVKDFFEIVRRVLFKRGGINMRHRFLISYLVWKLGIKLRNNFWHIQLNAKKQYLTIN